MKPGADPFLFAEWERAVFMQYTIAAELLHPHVTAPLELDLHEGKACLSVVAVTMRRFRPARWDSFAWAFRPLTRQCFLNFRTYVRHGNEPGALFLHGWLSRPWRTPLPNGMMGLPYGFASMTYNHSPEHGLIRGEVRNRPGQGSFAYRASAEPSDGCRPCEPGSLSEFALERYSGFFSRRDVVYEFRATHPTWLQMPLDVTIEDDSLITNAFPWFKAATLTGANFAPGFERVALGAAHRLPTSVTPKRAGHRLSAFYKIP